MTGIQRQAAKDIFAQLGARTSKGPELSVLVSYFEIYGGRCQVGVRACVRARGGCAGGGVSPLYLSMLMSTTYLPTYLPFVPCLTQANPLISIFLRDLALTLARTC